MCNPYVNLIGRKIGRIEEAPNNNIVKCFPFDLHNWVVMGGGIVNIKPYNIELVK